MNKNAPILKSGQFGTLMNLAEENTASVI